MRSRFQWWAYTDSGSGDGAAPGLFGFEFINGLSRQSIGYDHLVASIIRPCGSKQSELANHSHRKRPLLKGLAILLRILTFS
jgi:hypothetical protein